jgi:glycosyltransferase involved in cell wall biosynthesis
MISGSALESFRHRQPPFPARPGSDFWFWICVPARPDWDSGFRHLPPLISFIVPAHNEELLLGATLASIHAAAREAGAEYELIVVDDASTDNTAKVAADYSAHVIPVNNRQISATRNSGARAARGDLFIFVDADTLATGDAVRDVVAAVEKGAAGGGCLFRFDGKLPLWARLTCPLGIRLFRLLNVVGGCFIFCTRQAFDATGGFSDRHYAAEELIFTNAVKRIGRFVIPRALVVTSGRKLRSYTGFEILWTLLKITSRGTGSYRAREGLEVWYGQRRPDPETETRT